MGILNGLGSTDNAQQGVCYQVTATSGCLTVLMDSDGLINFSGFVGQWECTDDCPDDPTLTVNPGVDEAALAAGFSSPIMDVTVTNINCNNAAYGTFTATDDTNLGLGEGILLTTGVAAEASNPASFFANNNLNLGGDPDLNFLNDLQGNGMNTDDACFVEMDVFVKTDQLAFDYVFGSEEYKQNFSNFSNDLLGILVSGPGITGLPGLNGQENIAEIPTTGELIQVQTINANDNWQYYRDNNNSQSIAYNGLTTGFMGSPKALTAQRQVTPCQTYHVKLAIADIDDNDDSGFFVAPSSAGVPNMNVVFNTGIDYLVEGCTNISDLLVISLEYPSPTDLTFNVNVGGTATPFLDYLLNIPPQVTIPAGETSVSYALTSIPDNIPEGTETIEISLVADFGCGAIDLAAFSIDLTEELVVDVNGGADTVFVCAGLNSTQLNAVGAGSFEWSPANLFDNPNSANPTVTIANSQMVSVVGSLGTCTASDQVFLQIISPEVNIDIQNGGDDQLCQGESISLFANNNVGNTGLTWTPATPTPGDPINNQTPSFTTTYTATVETAGCTASDEITINVEPFAVPELTTTDTLICQNSSVMLASQVLGSSTSYEWTPVEGLDNPSTSNPIATPSETTTYTLNATSVNGICTETASVTINVLPANVDIAPELFEICLGEEVTFTANTTTNGQGLTWSPADSLSSTTDQTVTANPSISTWYVATLEIGECTVFDSVFVRVDSLPDMEITPIPDNSPFCEGEIISMISTGYADLDFPDIAHIWSPAVGAISTDTLLNFIVAATETTTYTRITTNNACSDTSEILIEVVPTPEINITPLDPVVCDGESVQLMATSDDITEFEWSPSAGLSCTECPDPDATPPATITYSVTGEFMGCPGFANILVTVSESPNLSIPNNPTICPETSIVLNNAAAEPNTIYEWTLEDGTFYSDEAQPEVEDLTETTTFLLTVDNGECNPIMESVTVNVVPVPTLNLESQDITICQGLSTTLTASVDTPNGTFIWSPNGENTGSITVSPGMTTVYSVIYISPLDCFQTDAQTVTVTVNESFQIENITSNPIVGFEGEIVDLMVNISPDGPNLNLGINGNAVLSEFNGSELETSNESPDFSPTLPLVDEDSQITYEIDITDDFGCNQSDTVTVVILNSLAEMPNAFTPNNDGSNDVFNLVKSPNVEILDFRIYNRWGKQVFEIAENPDGWDGNIDGNPASADVYMYIIDYKFGEVEQVLRGDVTLIR